MHYSPKYTYWLYKAGITVEVLPSELLQLIEQYEKVISLLQIENHTENQTENETEQISYQKALEQTDAYISARIYNQYADKFKQIIQSDEQQKLKALMDKAADLDF
jgi:hypothetical protein